MLPPTQQDSQGPAPRSDSEILIEIPPVTDGAPDDPIRADADGTVDQEIDADEDTGPTGTYPIALGLEGSD